MAGYTRKLKELLREAGCYYLSPGKGDHETWYSPISDVKFCVEANIKSRHTANEALKQAGLKKAF